MCVVGPVYGYGPVVDVLPRLIEVCGFGPVMVVLFGTNVIGLRV